MKTLLILLLATTFGFVSNVVAGSPTEALRQTLAQLRTARTLAQWQMAAGELARLSDQQPNHWLPAYWATYAYVVASFRAGNEADALLDQAEPYAERVARLKPSHDEVLVLQSYVAQARLAAKPMFRWMTYGPRADKALAAARQKNPNNPRISLLEGLALYHKPAQFGGGPAAACPHLRRAAEKFATFKPAGDLEPDWGQSELAPLLAQCK